MKHLRQRDNLRYITSFLIALLLHALLLLIQNGVWGQSGDQLQVTRIYSRLVEVENTPIEKKPTSIRPNVEEKPAKADLPIDPTEKCTLPEAKIEKEPQPTEVVQKEPAPRKVPPAGEEKSTVSHEETSKSAMEAEAKAGQTPAAPAPPPLPPLGNGHGMLVVNRTFYPKDLLNQGIEGVVRMEIFINEEGTLMKDPQIILSSGSAELDEHCLLTIKRIWKFKPAPKPYRLCVELNFTNDEVEGPRFLKEATYLSPEEGGTSE